MSRSRKIVVVSLIAVVGVAASLLFRKTGREASSVTTWTSGSVPLRSADPAARGAANPADAAIPGTATVAGVHPDNHPLPATPSTGSPSGDSGRDGPPPAVGPVGIAGQPTFTIPQPNFPGRSGSAGFSAPPRTHRIVDGDTLARIAQRYLGDSARSGEILELNRDKLASQELLPIGVVLKIPPREPPGIPPVVRPSGQGTVAEDGPSDLVPIPPSAFGRNTSTGP